MSVGERIEIYKEAVDPRDFVERFGLADVSATHALGHTRMATESRVTTEHSHPFSTGLDLCLVHNGSLSNHNRLRAFLRRQGIELPDRQRHRGRGRLSDLAPVRGRRPRAGASRLPRRPRRLLHLRGRHRRRLRRPARPDRLQAGGARRDRRLGGDGLRVPGDRRPARAPTRRSCGSPSRAASTRGSARWWREGRRASASESVDLATTSVRELNQRLHELEADGLAVAGRQPQRRPRDRRRPRCRGRGRDRGSRGLLLRRDEQARDRERRGNCGRRVAENMMSRAARDDESLSVEMTLFSATPGWLAPPTRTVASLFIPVQQ